MNNKEIVDALLTLQRFEKNYTCIFFVDMDSEFQEFGGWKILDEKDYLLTSVIFDYSKIHIKYFIFHHRVDYITFFLLLQFCNNR